MRIFGLLLGVVLAVIVAAWVIGGLVARSGMQSVGEEPWPIGLGTLASVETRYPAQKTNEAARRLVALAAPLGISFQTSADVPLLSSSLRDADKPNPVRTAIGEYVKSEHGRAEPAISEPPAAVLTYLAAHEAEIDALRDHLLEADPIVWDLDLSKGFDAPVPNLLGHMSARAAPHRPSAPARSAAMTSAPGMTCTGPGASLKAWSRARVDLPN